MRGAAAAALLLVACSSESNAVKILDATSEVYVLLAPESLVGSGPRSPDEVGTVPSKWSDDDLVFAHRDHEVDGASAPAMVVYTAPQMLPDGSVFLTVTPNQALELARDDEATGAVVVNPESPANSGVIPKARLGEALGRLTARKPMLKSISIVRE